MIQLTGRDLAPGMTHPPVPELADPAAPFVNASGELEIYGTAPYALVYRDWSALLAGEEPRRERFVLCHPDGAPATSCQASWDVLRHRWGDEDVLYAGTMARHEAEKPARWPHDNWSRRIFAFRRRGGAWVREEEPLFGAIPKRPTWIGHCYGHHFVEDEAGATWLFYERVTEQKRLRSGESIPFVTELFARKMLSPFHAADEEIPILGCGNPPWPSTRRTHHRTGAPNGYLVEGGRPVRVEHDGEDFYVLPFSSGDFPTDHYHLNVAVGKSAVGPYAPQLTADGGDLEDLGRAMREELSLSWGPARAVFFQDPAGDWWTMFHAVAKAVLPGRDYRQWPREPLSHFHRNLYLARLVFAKEAGALRVEIAWREAEAAESLAG